MKKTNFIKILGTMLLTGVMALTFINPISAMADSSNLKNYYTADYDTFEEATAHGKELREDVFDEGIVMLKNEDCFPIEAGSKISVFGKNSNQKGLRESLAASGYQVNPTLVNFYSKSALSGSGRGTVPSRGTIISGFNTGETPVENYTADIQASFAEYNACAVVVFFRSSDEASDPSRTMMTSWTDSTPVNGARNSDDHYLQLDQNETDLLKLCNDNFDKVIVMLITPSSFETGFLDDPGHYAYQPNIKGAFYIGMPHSGSLASVGYMMQGKVNPSGRLVDTWARDFKLDPTWNNFGSYLSADGNVYTNLTTAQVSPLIYTTRYVTYNEGIYVGYRYYETRGFTEGTSAYSSDDGGTNKIHGTTTTNWDSWYQSNVVYPYGYGLSFTTFSQEIVNVNPAKNTQITDKTKITIDVKVTNTGDTYSGKEVVQVYYTAPYTTNGIEKAYVVLAGYGKTQILAPGESEIVKITFDGEDMASYDYADKNGNGFKGYELEGGTYTIKLMSNAHEVIDSFDYTVASEGIKIATDSTTGYTVENRFDDVSSYITDSVEDGGLGQEYLSRADWEGTWPEFNKNLTASQRVVDGLTEWKVKSGVQQRDSSLDSEEPLYTTEMPTTGAEGTTVLSDLNGKGYDDPLWEGYLDRFTIEELTYLVCHGGYLCGADLPDKGVKISNNIDSRTGLYGTGGSGTISGETHLGDMIILAQTWNEELAYEFGKQVGNEALWYSTSKCDSDNTCAWYAPSINIHRSQFGGRNYQYYGEDPLLAGRMASQICIGAQEKGLATYVKHFAVNNQETNRIGLTTWVNEQAMREIYMKGFEITVKEGKTLGIMSSLNRIGTEWAGGSYDLLTEILRNEWGFNGCVVTDSYMGDSSNISNADQMIRAGGNLCLNNNAHILYNVDTPTTVYCLREAAHGILYMMANSNAVNGLPAGKYDIVENFTGKTLANAVVGVKYSQDIASATLNQTIFEGVDPSVIEYGVAEGSELPAGLTVSKEGVISGKPTKAVNNYTFTLTASYAGESATASFVISIIDVNGSIVYQKDSALGSVRINEATTIDVGGAYIYKPSQKEGEVLPDITYSLKSGEKLPQGLTLGSDGKITGTPTRECTNYQFTVLANAEGYESQSVTFTISVHYPMTFTGKTLKSGEIGQTYVDSVNVAQSVNKVTYALKSGEYLPNGLTLTANGTIVGTPKEAITKEFTIIASSDFCDDIEGVFTISIGLHFNDIDTIYVDANKNNVIMVDTCQGAGSCIYSVVDGELPEGLTLTEDGMITGKATKEGIYTVTIGASASGKVGDTTTITIVVDSQFNILPIAIGGGVVVIVGGIAIILFLSKKKKG